MTVKQLIRELLSAVPVVVEMIENQSLNWSVFFGVRYSDFYIDSSDGSRLNVLVIDDPRDDFLTVEIVKHINSRKYTYASLSFKLERGSYFVVRDGHFAYDFQRRSRRGKDFKAVLSHSGKILKRCYE